jgi:hypothetical protein
MPFQIQNFARVSASANEDIVAVEQMNTVASPAYMYYADMQGCFRRHSYFSSTFVGTGNIAPANNPIPTGGDTQVVIGGNYAVVNNANGVPVYTYPVPAGAIAIGYFDAVASDLQVNDLIDAYSAVDNFRITYRVTAINASSPKVVVTPTNCTGFVKLYAPLTPVLDANNKILSYTLLATPITVIPAMNNAIVVVNRVAYATNAGQAYGAGGSIVLTYSNGVVIVAGVNTVQTNLVANTAAFLPQVIASNTAGFAALGNGYANQGVVLISMAAFTAPAPNTVKPLIVYVEYSVFATV